MATARLIVQLVAIGVALWYLITLPFWINHMLILFVIFALLELLGYGWNLFHSPIQTSRNRLAWLASLLMAVYPSFVSRMIQYPIHNFTLLMQVGSSLQYIAILFEIVALATLRTSFTILPESHRFVRQGIYRFVRHPLYSAYFVGYGGFALSINQPAIWIVYMVLVVSEIIRAKAEETVLLKTFPEYNIYRQQTGMFWPMLKGGEK